MPQTTRDVHLEASFRITSGLLRIGQVGLIWTHAAADMSILIMDTRKGSWLPQTNTEMSM